MDVPASPVADPLFDRENHRAELEHHFGHLIVEVRLPPDNADKDADEARRRLLGIWPGLSGNWSHLAQLGTELGHTRLKRDQVPGWNVLGKRRLVQEEARLVDEQAQYRTRLAGLFESALDNFAILKAAGAVVHFEEPAPGP